jgi:hypothetical protein
LKNNYNIYFIGFLVSVLLVFFWIRPINSPWHKFIAGDGLGYYAYLPAKFNHGDPNYDFKWFNKVYNANYTYSAFENPEDNLLVKYKDKRINKYYPGLSYVWFPFYCVAHIVAKVFHYPTDGFSEPYQLFIGLASLVYLFIGLIFLRKLIILLFKSELLGVAIPIMIYYGTHLFNYSIFANSLSHTYSFTFIILFLYYAILFLNNQKNRTTNFLLCLFFLVITVCIRPLNGLVILAVPAFLPKIFPIIKPSLKGLRLAQIMLIFLILFAFMNQFNIMYKQTGTFFPYTYTNERFNFGSNQFINTLFSYHIGIFIYVPIVFMSVIGSMFLPRKQLILPLLFFGVLFLYSAWWYWPITKRAMIDFYVLPAIMLAALLNKPKKNVIKLTLSALCVLCVIHYQFKEMQIRRGILNEFATYKEVFWENYFRIGKLNRHFIPPSSIIAKKEYTENFESDEFKKIRTSENKYSEKYAILVDSKNYFCTYLEYPFPVLFQSKEFKKVRFSFYSYFTAGIKDAHVFIQFFDKNHKSILDVPFYLSEENIVENQWEFKEFGCELTDTTLINYNTVDKIGFTIWNVEAKGRIYIDASKAEFILTNKSFETIIN